MRKNLLGEGGTLWSIDDTPIERTAGGDVTGLPRKSDVRRAMNQAEYDEWPWSANASGGHRNSLEGWINGPQLHNRVHVWIGGDMGPSTSPNDPAFFLNHCNVYRIWEAWMVRNGRTYMPDTGPAGHHLNDSMFALLGEAMTPGQVLDPSPNYDYDDLNVE